MLLGKTFSKFFCSILIFILGFGVGLWYSDFTPDPEINGIPKELSEKNRRVIDSLYTEVNKRESIIDSLDEEVKVIEVTKTVVLDSIRELSVDESATYLMNKLKEYENESK